MTSGELAGLLGEPLVLSQRHLLREREFLDECKQRGFDPPEREPLANLHKLGVLTPLIGVRWSAKTRGAARDMPEGERRRLFGWVPVEAPDLLAGLRDGTWTIEPAPPFSPPKRRRSRVGNVGFLAVEYLYSPYQVLQLPAIQAYLAARARGRVYKDWSDRLLAAAQRSDAQIRSLAIVLTRLEPYFYPFIRRRLRAPIGAGDLESIDRAIADFDVGAFRATLAASPAELQKAAEGLLWTAHTRDPMRNWLDLLAEVGPDKWERLRGDARLAVDLRVAAEILLRYIEELAEKGFADPLPDIPPRATHPLNERLRPRPAELDAILTNYDLSPHPSLVLVLEGTSEMDVAPKAMRALGIPVRDSFIRLVNLGGINKQLELLARYIVPSLRRVGGNSAELLRPPTRLMVVTDAEPPYASRAARAKLRSDLAKHVWNALEAQFQTKAALADIETLIDVVTWTPRRQSNFEFAHFTDLQIARAILMTGRAPAGLDISALATSITGVRQGGGNLKRVWQTWTAPTPDKPLVWQYLWPMLERRIIRLGPERRARVPLVRVLEVARAKASGPRSNLLLRV